jgi:hypothetical protein
MNVLKQGYHKGRKIVMGKAAYGEMDLLNKEKNFNQALDRIYSIKKTHNYLFDLNDTMRVAREIQGKEKVVKK